MKLSNGDGYLDENEILFLLKELKLDLNKSKEVEKQQVRAMIALLETPAPVTVNWTSKNSSL